ncbi:hypothetical protein ABBQ38_012230 [Trebouxia sp. C0009 RCD-2024]
MRSISNVVLRAVRTQSVSPGSNPSTPVYGSRSFQAMSSKVFGFGSHKSDNDPDKLEKEKRKNLKGDPTKGKEQEHHAIPGAAGWNEELASDSEASVKADRHAPDSVDELQKLSVKHLHGQVDEEPSAADKDPVKKGKANPVN